MQRVQTVASFGGYQSDVVSSKLHGTNMLFHTDRTEVDSDFRSVIEKIGTEFIRFPGGTVSEEYFDITNPDATRQSNFLDIQNGASNIRTKSVTTLSEYLSYKAELDGDAVIVLPTYRFFDPNTGGLRSTAEAEVKQFIHELMSDTYGDVDQVTIELGNEWYQSRFDWSAEEFGLVQSSLAQWIDDAAREMGVRDDMSILAQTGQDTAQHQVLSTFFDSDPSVIDGVLTHLYGTNSSGNPLGIGGGIGARLEAINDTWGQLLGPDFQLAVTEWNVGESGEATTLINGVMRSAPLLRIYAEMLEGGVDMAMIWSAQTRGPAGLSEKDGDENTLSPTGYLFSMLAESTEGLRLVDQDADFKLRSDTGDAVGYTYTFEGDDHSVTYFASGIGEEFKLDANMAAYASSGAYVYARVLDVAPGQDVSGYWSDASLTYKTNLHLSGSTKTFDYTFQPYQLVELHVITGRGVEISGDSQNDLADRLNGSTYADILAGQGGTDRLNGLDGNDELDGGDGQDVLLGGRHDDRMFGGSGNDFMYGGQDQDIMSGGDGNDRMRGNRGNDEIHGDGGIDVLFGGGGNDSLSGGKHRDYLLGENGNDRLDGGIGNDNLYGGNGSDVFVFQHADYGYDRILDFVPRQDKIDFSTFEFTSFQQVLDHASDTEHGVKMNFGDGNVLLLSGLTIEDLDEGDILL